MTAWFCKGRFDLITVAQAIHWFNFDEFYDEVCRVGRTGGLLAVIGYSMISINDKADPILEALYEEAFGTYFNENRQYLDQYYRTIPFPFEEIQTPNLEYTVSWSIDELEGYFNSWSAIQKMKSDQGYNPVPKTMNKLKSKLPETQKLEVSFPIFMRLGRLSTSR
ncbi:hypothetical protein [Fodinibius halophilus]|uniref:Class I SAM-dependent methyltransferase n=1 Tax=Fodinibius halophilus TaxID=1736908 RepID=A0A6M1SVI8_9BACT|nr:hypothetical protein [Fodinibius halophilus]NGP87948.1 hypothetical protein [Fodinibius halophilus]